MANTGAGNGDKGASVFNGDLEFTPEEDAILDEIWDRIIAEEGETGDEDLQDLGEDEDEAAK